MPVTFGREKNRMLDELAQHLKQEKPRPLGKRREFVILAPIVAGEKGYDLLYEVRGEDISQAGETSFPGGGLEAGESPLEAALRETHEEIGVPVEDIRVLGELGWLISDRVIIHVFVGYIEDYVAGRYPIDPEEVADLVQVPMAWLKANPPAIYKLNFRAEPTGDFPWDRVPGGEDYAWSRQGHEVVFYPLPPNGLNIWGFTAQVTRDLLAFIPATTL